MPQAIGIDRRHWRNAAHAAQRARRRRDELEIEALLDEAGMEGDERAAVSGERCAGCGRMVLVDANYVPYAPAGVLVCSDCLDADDREPAHPGAIVRDWTGR